MRVIHINYNDSSGGAAKAAIRLVEAQRRLGMDSHLLVLKKQTDKSYVHTVGPLARLFSQLGNLLSQRLFLPLVGLWKDQTVRSLNVWPSFLIFKLWKLKPDIVHLHWLGNETLAFYQLSRLKRPVVWTMHDMWSFCASEHYPPESRYSQFLNGYKYRDQSSSSLAYYVDRLLFSAKRSCFSSSMEFIAPSQWLREMAMNSAMILGSKVHHINNCAIDKIYTPMNSIEARRKLGLPVTTTLFAFGAVNATTDPRKGYDLLKQALEILSSEFEVDFDIVVFGATKQSVMISGVAVHDLGEINDDQKMALVYNAVDVFIAPSLQDNLPNTVVEAQACGVPCVAFDIGGMSELIPDKGFGRLAFERSPRALANALASIRDGEFSKNTIAGAARSKRGETVVVGQHQIVYDDLINRAT